MNFVVSPIIKLLGGLLALGITLGYISVLRSDNKALEASLQSYKQQLEMVSTTANKNAALLVRREEEYQQLQQMLVLLQAKINVSKTKIIEHEKEVIKYVERLPEGFEKQCLNMHVPDAIGRVQDN